MIKLLLNYLLINGLVAQLGERCPCKAEAPGSSPGESISLIFIFINVIICAAPIMRIIWCEEMII